MKHASKSWFWVDTVHMAVVKARIADPDVLSEVWISLRIIRAKDAREAYAKACRLGHQEAGDSGGTLTLNGRRATQKFLGLAGMGVLHDGLKDGAEINWRIKKCQQRNAVKLVKAKEELIPIVHKELTHQLGVLKVARRWAVVRRAQQRRRPRRNAFKEMRSPGSGPHN